MTETRVAPAKLTLTLRMLDKRDDGFNNLEALTVFLPDIADVITHNEEGSGLSIQGPSGESLTSDESNLVVKARDLFLAHERIADLHEEVENIGLELTKNIPIAAGLGGGSADAAATLHLLNRICGDQLTMTELGWLAEELGSDVPACVYSQSLWMRGRGEVVAPLDDYIEGVFAFVVTPNIECSTPAVFKRYEEMGRPVDTGIAAPVSLHAHTATLHNDLALAAYDLFPKLHQAKNDVEKVLGVPMMLAGSGSTLFCVGTETEMKEVEEKSSELSDVRLKALSYLV